MYHATSEGVTGNLQEGVLCSHCVGSRDKTWLLCPVDLARSSVLAARAFTHTVNFLALLCFIIQFLFTFILSLMLSLFNIHSFTHSFIYSFTGFLNSSVYSFIHFLHSCFTDQLLHVSFFVQGWVYKDKPYSPFLVASDPLAQGIKCPQQPSIHHGLHWWKPETSVSEQRLESHWWGC